MEAFINWIGSFLVGVLQWLFDLVKTVFLVFWDLLVDLICFVLDALLGFAVSLIQALPVDLQGFNPNSYLQGAPAEFLGMLVAIRVPEAIGIIVVALGIRFALQLIPFIRLGS